MFGIDDAALAIMLAGGISTAAGLYTNKKNRESQENANAINWEIARQNNATQIEMANTAHQREVRDLRRAGLNPILSAGGSGASTPTLQAPNINPVHIDNAFNGLANSAKGVGRFLSQQYKLGVEQSEWNAELLKNQSQLANQQYDRTMQQNLYEIPTHELEWQNDYMRALLEREAIKREYGLAPKLDKFGHMQGVKNFSENAFVRSLDLAREGLRSDLKNRANANWRANLSAFTGAGSSAANSAASLVRSMNQK